jgi:hypothetical protein
VTVYDCAANKLTAQLSIVLRDTGLQINGVLSGKVGNTAAEYVLNTRHRYIHDLLTLSLLMSFTYRAPSKARNLTSYIYTHMDKIFYWGFCFLNRAFR